MVPLQLHDAQTQVIRPLKTVQTARRVLGLDHRRTRQLEAPRVTVIVVRGQVSGSRVGEVATLPSPGGATTASRCSNTGHPTAHVRVNPSDAFSDEIHQ